MPTAYETYLAAKSGSQETAYQRYLREKLAAGRVQSPGVVAPTNPPPPTNPLRDVPVQPSASTMVSPDYKQVDTGFGPKYAEPVARGIVNAATTIPFTDIGRLGDKVYGPRKPWQSAGAEFAGEFVGAAGPYSLASKGLQTVATGIKGIRGLYTATKLAEDATTAQKAAHLGIETAKAAGRGAIFGGVGEGLGQAADAAGRAYSGREGQVDYTEPLKQAGFFAGIDAALTLLHPALRGLGGAIRGHLKAGNVAAAEELVAKLPEGEHKQAVSESISEWKKVLEGTKVVDEAGNPVPTYSGHTNTQLYKEYNPKKSVAGGFYATEDPAIASNYATGKFGDKRNISGADDYQFRDKKGDYTKKLGQIKLTPEQQAKLESFKGTKNEYGEYDHPISEMDYYIENNAKFDKDARRWQMTGGSKNLKNVYEFYEQMGHTIRYSDDNGAMQSSHFDDLLNALGVDWSSHFVPQPGVMKNYLNIKNPIDVSEPFPPNVLGALEEAAKRERVKDWQDQYSTHWTSDYPLKQWVEDIKSGNEYWATQIPKKAVQILKRYGYDGIKDSGGKGGGPRHNVWVAFDKEQIHNAFGPAPVPRETLKPTEILSDKENISGLPSDIGKGQAPVKAEPVKGAGAEEVSRNRVVQKPQEVTSRPGRELITPSEDRLVGVNSAGEKLYERASGDRYRIRLDREDRPNGYPDFGGDLAPVESTQPAPVVGAEPGAGLKPPAPVSEPAPVSPAKQPTVSQTWYAGHGEGKPTGKYLYVTDSPEYAKQFGEVKPYEVSPENTADFSYLGERSVSRERAIAELKKKGVEAQIPLDDDVYKPMWQWVRKYPQIADQVKSSGFDSMAFKETFGGTGKRHNSLMILDESKFGEPPVSPAKQPLGGKAKKAPTPKQATAEALKLHSNLWELTKDEYLNLYKGKTYKEALGRTSTYRFDETAQGLAERREFEYRHKTFIEKSLKEGKPVPPSVLADYPDLVAQGAKPLKRGPSDVVAQSAVGGALGFQEKKDEQGNVIGYEYDPVKGLIGMTGGMAIGMAVNRRGKSPKVETPPENPTPGDINLNRINLTEPERVAAKVRVNQLKPALEKMKGTKLTNDEVIEAAKEVKMSAEVVARSETLKRSAQILNARKNEAELLRKENVTPSELRNILETVRQVESVKTDLGREMQKLSINVDPELQSTRSALMTKLAKSDIDLGAIEAKAAEYAKQGKSLDDPRNVMEFYREFIKPKASEILDEYRYINMLSSPNTHIVNTTSNLIQGFILRPGTRLAAGGIDAVGSKLTGSERTYYARQVPSYYRGMLNSLPAAIQGVRDVMTGKALTLRPDLQYLPTNSKWTKWGYPVTRALEASDIFVRTLVEGGEKEALAYKAKRTGKEINPEAIDAEARQTAAEVVFRGELDPSNATGQGLIKSKVFDAPASMLNRLRQLSPPFKWLVPFVQTPLNIAKQGFEYSPLGFAEFGVKDKTAQLAKASIGSTVFVGAGYIALNNGSTWAVPSGKKAKDEFYAAGMKPYSLKIGDTWVSYSKLGPLAYPIALAAALKYHFKDSPSALSDTYSDKVAAGLAEMAQFFSDQSYVQSIGNIIDATKGATTGEWKGEVSQLIGGTGRQLIPLAALQGWVNGIIDPIYRKSEKDLTPEAILQNMQKNVIGLSTNLEPYKDRKDQLSRRALPVGNAFSPFQVSPVDSTGAAQFDKASKERQSETLIRKLKEAQKENDTTEVKRLNDIRAKAGIPAPEPTKPRLPKLPKVGPISQADIDSIPAHIQVKYQGVKSKSGEKVQMTGPARQVLKDLYAESDLYTKILESLT